MKRRVGTRHGRVDQTAVYFLSQPLVRWRVLVLTLLLALLCGAPGYAAQGTEQEHRANLEKIKQRIASIRKKMRGARGEHDQLTEQLQSAESSIGAVTKAIHELTQKIAATRGELNGLRQDEQIQSDKLLSERTRLERQIYSAYAMGRQERLKIMLSQQDPASLSRVMTYYDYLNRERARRMTVLDRQVAELRATQGAILEREHLLKDLQGKELASRDALEQQQDQRREVLAGLVSELRDADQELTRLQSDQAQLQKLLLEIQQALADIPDEAPGAEPFKQRKGKLSWPAKGRIASAFGSPKIGGMTWDGVMISAQQDEAVHAVHHGRVAFADWLRGFGLLLILDHGDGWMTLYGHNQGLFKEVGDWVEAGEPLAQIGNSGGRQASGVYFGIRHQGKAVDPGRWCRKPRGGRVG